MKWKRSKKAQQEAKSKDNHGEEKSKNSSASNKILPINNAKAMDEQQQQQRHNRLETTNTIIGESMFNPAHKTANLEQHTIPQQQHQQRQQFNLITSNLKEFSTNIEDSLPSATLLNRRPLLFPDGNNGEMFRPYVV
jgi:uncharacterized membrane protein YccC